MANAFLVEIHDYISRQIEASLKYREEARDRSDEKRLAFIDGHLLELQLMRQFLSERFDLTTQKYF
jgi:hypothetical protein